MGSNAKNKRIIGILLLGIAVAAAAGFFLYQYLKPLKKTIYVFNDNYKAGQVVTDEILTPVQVDAKIVVAGADADVSTQFITGANKKEFLEQKENALRMDVAKGMPLTQAMLSVDGGSYIEMNMDGQKVAVSVPITSVSGVSDDLSNGSRVNIYATGTSENGRLETKLIFENMRILSVERDSNGSISAATIEVTTDESLKLINAATVSSLYFGLVNGSGYQSVGAVSDMPDSSESEVAVPASEETTVAVEPTDAAQETAAPAADTEMDANGNTIVNDGEGTTEGE